MYRLHCGSQTLHSASVAVGDNVRSVAVCVLWYGCCNVSS